MDLGAPSYVTKMFDEFRDGTLRGPNPRVSGAFPLAPLPTDSPLLAPKNLARLPFDESFLNRNDYLIKRKRAADESLSSDRSADDSEVAASPWEFRRTKNELVEARAEITALETRITQLHNLRKETELLFEQEKNSLKQTIDRDRITIKDLEQRVKVLKKREEKLKEELLSAVAASSCKNQTLETKTIEIQQENVNLKHKVAQLENNNAEMSREINSVKTESSGLNQELSTLRDKFDGLNNQLADLKIVVRQYETEKASFIKAQHRIKELETQQKNQEEVAFLVKTQHMKLARYSELEKQLNALTQDNNRLRESTSNSIYLEGIVEDLKGRLCTLEERDTELKKLRVELGTIAAQLSEYQALSERVLGTDSSSGPTALANYLRHLHSEHLVSKSQQSQLQARLKTVEEAQQNSATECNNLKLEVEKLRKEIELHISNIRRLKKQNALIAWERNDLRSLVDSCQKEVTMTAASIDPKMEALERLVEGYRKRMEQLENDPTLAVTQIPVSGSKSEGVSIAEIETLRKERDELLAKVDSLNYEMEHRSLKGDFNTQQTKIVHMRLNPASEAETKKADELEKCKCEIAKLKERVRLMQEGHTADITLSVDQKVDEAITKELEVLRDKVKSQELQNQRLREAFKTTGHEFREAIFSLLGYKVDGLPNKVYRLSNLYAESPDHHLIFKMSQQGDMKLLETEFSTTLSDLIELHLCQQNSIPVFLSSVTIDLFQRQSQHSSYIAQQEIN